MALVELETAKKLAVEYKTNKKYETKRDSDTYLRILEKVLDEDFQKAEPTLENIDITTVAGTLKIQRTVPQKMAYSIALGVCTYWSKTIETSGDPESNTGIDAVVNDAMVYVKPMETDILAIYKNRPSYPEYYEFVSVIFKYVKQIIWIVDESDSSTYNTQVL
jgi:hypothetical protein